MTRAAVVNTRVEDSLEAGEALGRDLLEQFGGTPPNAVILFASPVYAPDVLLRGLHDACAPGVLIGCSSAGEFTFEGTSASSAVALGLESDDMRFSAHVVRHAQADVELAARSLASEFDLAEDGAFPFRAALLLMDTLAGYGEEFLEVFTAATAGRYQVFGGGAADDAAFEQTHVFVGREAVTDAAVALEIRSRQPIGIGVSHGWTPASHEMTVTSSSGLRLIEIDGRPAADVFEDFAREQAHTFDREAPLPFFLHHVLGIASDVGYRLRVPLKLEPGGALVCAAEVPEGSTVRIMQTRNASAAEAAHVAARRAWLGLEGREPVVAIFFDCAATRLRLGDAFQASVDEILATVGTGTGVGCNTYGQFARLEGQFSGYHNCTAVVCVLPR